MNDAILIAADDKALRILLEKHLTDEGFNVILAKDGEEAVNLLTQDICVALIDFNMPKKNGIECLKFIQREFSTIQVIIVTAVNDVQNTVEAMKSGAYYYVTKPVDTGLVKKTVKNAFNAYKTHMEYSEIKEEVEKLTKYPEENPNPVIRVNKKTIVEYCNNSARLLLQEYGCSLNKEISGLFLETVRDVFESREVKSIQIQAASNYYSMTFVPVADAEYINIYGYKINELIEKERDLNQSKKLLQAITKAQTQYIEDVIPRLLFDELLLNLLSLTNSEYGFIGEILYTPEKIPYLKTHAITNIAWNDETRKFYDENAPKGMEFHNLKTLFGEVMVTGKPVISNNPGTDTRRGGLPEGHPPLNAFLGIPFYKANRLVGMVGISNRPGGYDENLITYLNPFLFICANIIDAYRIDRMRIETDKALKEQDARIRAVLNNVVDGIISINEKGIVESYNPAAERIFGYSLDEALGKNIKMLMPEEYSEKHDGFIADYLKTGKAHVIGIGREVQGMRKDGTIFPIDLAVSEVKLEGKRIFSGIVRDITERKRSEEALELNAQRMTEAYEQSKKYAEALNNEISERKQAQLELAQARELEIEIGTKIQQSLLNEKIPTEITDVKISTLSIPSQQIDGDFYDFFVYNNNCFDVLIGDVMGKGIPAALIGAGAKSRFSRSITRLLSSAKGTALPKPRDIVSTVHSEITGQLINVDRFITLFYSRIDLEKKTLQFVDCGHSYVIHYKPEIDSLTYLRGQNMPIGFSEWENYQQAEVTFEPNDVFIYYSDGIIDACNKKGEFFGGKRFEEIVKSKYRGNVEEFQKALHKELIEFSGSDIFSDDVTCVIIKILSPEKTDDFLEISSDLANLREVRSFIRSFCVKIHNHLVNEDKLNLLELGVNELISNIIKHGYKGQKGRKIQLKASAMPDRIVIEIQDWGEAYDLHHFKPPKFDMYQEGGFGLYIINKAIDEIKYIRKEDETNYVYLAQLCK